MIDDLMTLERYVAATKTRTRTDERKLAPVLVLALAQSGCWCWALRLCEPVHPSRTEERHMIEGGAEKEENDDDDDRQFQVRLDRQCC